MNFCCRQQGELAILILLITLKPLPFLYISQKIWSPELETKWNFVTNDTVLHITHCSFWVDFALVMRARWQELRADPYRLRLTSAGVFSLLIQEELLSSDLVHMPKPLCSQKTGILCNLYKYANYTLTELHLYIVDVVMLWSADMQIVHLCRIRDRTSGLAKYWKDRDNKHFRF